METTTLGPTVGPDKTGWLAARREGIGASEAPAVLGLSPHMSPLELYLKKTGQLPDAPQTEAQWWGLELEPIIAKRYQIVTGQRIASQQVFCHHPRHSRIFATIDGITDGGRLVEFKTVSPFKAAELGPAGSDDIPHHWLIQAHQQMAVASADQVTFAVLCGANDFRLYEVPYRPALAQHVLDQVAAFWDRVERRDPPPISKPSDARALSLAFGNPEGAVALDEEAIELADLFDELGAQIRTSEKQRDLAKARLIALMENAASATLPDGREIVRKAVNRAGYLVKDTSYVSFSVRQPKGGRRGE